MKKQSGKRLIVLLAMIAAIGAFSLLWRAHLHSEPSACASCHIMQEGVEGWASGAHRSVDCLECHDPSLWLEITNLGRTLAGTVTQPQPITFQPEQCLTCHPANPRWTNIAEIVDARPQSDTSGRDLAVIAHAHFERSDCQSCHKDTAHGTVELLSRRLSTDVPLTLDGRLDEGLWKTAAPLLVPIMGGNSIGRIAVELRALHSDTDIFIAARWPDRRDDAEKAMWEMGSDGKWHKLGRTRAGEPGNEDRVLFLWDVSIPDFSQQGCLVTCHLDVSASKYLESPGLGDIWHWKAARSNPAGYCDDKHITHIRSGSDGGRHGDATDQKPGTVENVNDRGDGPAFMHDPAHEPTDPRFLFAQTAQPIPAQAVFKPGTRIPGYLLSRPDGSRGDVEAAGYWENGFWTVEFRRKRVTGHADDVAFDDLTRRYPFALAAVDNASGAEHSFSGVLQLRFIDN